MTQNSSAKLTRKSKSSFLASFKFLPKEKREAIYSVYAWCRRTDDISDALTSASEKKENMLAWQEEMEMTFQGRPTQKITSELAKVLERFPIQKSYFKEMIDVMWMDIEGFSYKTWDDLIKYCHGVASTVGLMSIEIFGYQNWQTRQFAEDLGIALQLTNIARDIKKDAGIGRIYLPETLMDKYGISADQIFQNRFDHKLQNMMFEFSDKISHYFNQAKSSLPDEDRKSMLPSLIMGEIYFQIYRRLKRANFNVFTSEIKLKKREKAFHAIKVWLNPKTAI